MRTDCNGIRLVMGIDLSDKTAQFCLLDSAGGIQNEGKIRLTPKPRTLSRAAARHY